MIDEEKPSNMRSWIVLYLDMIIRGLIAFSVIGIGFFVLLVGFLKMKVIYMLPIAFVTSILISPFLSKVRLGERVLTKYENLLKKLFKAK